MLKIFHDTVLVLEREDGIVCELYDMMFTLKTKLREDMCNFYHSSLTYLEQRYDFSEPIQLLPSL